MKKSAFLLAVFSLLTIGMFAQVAPKNQQPPVKHNPATKTQQVDKKPVKAPPRSIASKKAAYKTAQKVSQAPKGQPQKAQAPKQ